MKIALACDHAGFRYKEMVKAFLVSKGLGVADFGTKSEDPVDYPDYIKPASQSVARGEANLGIIFGGSGNEAIVANRLTGIRCAVVWNQQTAKLSKQHGDCNMIALGQRLIPENDLLPIVEVWLSSEFKGGRHQRRIDKIDG